MSWNKIKQICFGVLMIKPDDFYCYKLSDLWLTLKGWSDKEMFDLRVQRQMAIITGEITNRTMGGNGVVDYIMKAFPLPNDKQNEVAALTPEKITELIELYNARQAAKRKK